MFEEAFTIVNRAAEKFLALVTQFDRLQRAQLRNQGGRDCLRRVVERIIKALHRSFITPFDREDIHTLATRLDDILDNMDETASSLRGFPYREADAGRRAMARIIHDCCGQLATGAPVVP